MSETKYWMGVHFKAGERVSHSTWGSGTVIEDSDYDSTTVLFDEETDHGETVRVSSVLLKELREGP